PPTNTRQRWRKPPNKTSFCPFKEEPHKKACPPFSQLKQEIKDYMKYHNQHRYQWNLKKMTPVEYRNHLLAAA
ncbi:IS3 family transposase, partial [Bacillus cytotoxicus]|uniref:IS3 family transposase n=1 Tax=Bacillus cytotoxicus TaxID=580165 RepID=UPI002FE54F74